VAILAGASLALAFPTPGWAGLGWLGPSLLLVAALGARGGRAFRLGYLAGLVWHLVALRWLLLIPFPAGAAAGWLALSAYLALYPAAWVWLCWRLCPFPSRHTVDPASGPPTVLGSAEPSLARLASAPSGWEGASEGVPPATGEPLAGRFGWSGPAPSTLVPRWVRMLGPFLQMGWGRRLLWCGGCAVAWVALEMVQGRLLSGFPWNFLGVSQYRVLPLLQVASVTGVYGVSFLVVWVSVALLCASLKLAGRFSEPLPERLGRAWGSTTRRGVFPPSPGPSLLVSFRLALFADLALPLVILVWVTFVGGSRLVQPAAARGVLTVALVQPSIPQRLIFDPRESTNRFDALMDLTRQALFEEPDLLVWPEASLPELDEAQYRSLTNLIATHQVWMVFGADDAAPRAGGTGTSGYDYFNSAFLFDPRGEYVSSYRKRQLVIFGEYVPLSDWLPVTRWLTPIQGSFTPGRGPVPFILGEPAAKLAVSICFEDVFPHLVRESIEADTDFLLNLTNNGWFGESAAQWQHAANAVFRAVETGRPLVRCTNNGLTCWIDELGRLTEFRYGRPPTVYAPGFTIVRVPLRPPEAPGALTTYGRYGDVFGWACVAGIGLALGCRQSLRMARTALSKAASSSSVPREMRK